MLKSHTQKPNTWSEERIAALVEAHRFPLLYFATGIIGNLTDAEDIVEDAFVRLLVKKPRLRDENAMKTYLFTTAKHIAIDYLRKNRRRLKEQKDLEYLPETDVQFLEESVCKTETQREIAAALHTLSPDYREVLYLLYFEELSTAEISKIMGKTKKQIYNLAARAKKALAEILQKEDTPYEN